MLLPCACKMLCRIILERMKDALDERLRHEQALAEFGKARSCCDQAATLRIIVEQTLERNTGLYMVFVDFEEAFDSIDRNVLWKIFRHFGVPEKIVRLSQAFQEGFQARVLHEEDVTEPFDMKTGVRQGCLLSPVFFLVALDWVTRQSTGIQFTLLQKLEDLEFADDLVLLSHRVSQMRQKLEALQEQAAKIGLKVNVSKTKETRIRSPANTGGIIYGGKILEQVTALTYLGSLITTTGGTEEDVEARCSREQAAFCILRPVWRSKCISLWKKLRIFDSKLQVFMNRRLRYILGVW